MQIFCGSGFQPRQLASRLEAAPTFNAICSFRTTKKFNLLADFSQDLKN